MSDPRAIARRKFSSPPRWVGFDLLARCATDPPLAIRTLVDAVRPELAGDRICELGFGEGWLLDEISSNFPEAPVYGLDQSPSYVRQASERLPHARIVRGDMEALPFADASFGAIVTCWTLYFMRDIDAALEGMKRCLRPGGRFIAATVAPDHMLEHEQLSAAAMRSALGREPPPDVGARFDLATGEPYMRRHFAHVELREWHGELMVPDAETALQLWQSYPPDGLQGQEAAAVGAEYLRLAGEQLRDGPVRVTRHDGAFVATDR